MKTSGKLLFSLMMLLLLNSTVSGEVTNSYATIYNVRNYGAKGDGKTLDSPAINSAIQVANSAGGGIVYLPPGRYLSGSIRMKSNIELRLELGAVIVADKWDSNSYDPTEVFTPPAYQDGGHTFFHNSLIWGENLTNVSITGQGMIDGSGLTSWQGELNIKMGFINNLPGIPDVPMVPTLAANKAIAFKLCTNIVIRDITILKGGWFAILVTGCDNTLMENLTIDTNRDGIDIDCCTNTIVNNCKVNSPADDGICPKSTYILGRKVITENLTISNCQVSGYKLGTLLDGTKVPITGGVGRIKFGTESNAGFRNCTVINCTFTECRGLAIECVDGGILENIVCSNLTMKDMNRYGIYIVLGSRLRDPNPGISTGGNISISDVVGTMKDSINCIQLFGTPDTMLYKISLSNIRFQLKGGGTRTQSNSPFPELGTNYPDPTTKMLPAYGLYARHIKNLQLKDISLDYTLTEFRPAVYCSDVDSISFVNLNAAAAPNTPFAQFENTKNIYTTNSAVIDTGLVAMNYGNWQLLQKGKGFQLFDLTTDKECTINAASANASTLTNLIPEFKAMFNPYKGFTTSLSSQVIDRNCFNFNSLTKTLTINGNPNAQISIFNCFGNLMFNQESSGSINLQSFSKGIYLLSTYFKSGERMNDKFIIN